MHVSRSDYDTMLNIKYDTTKYNCKYLQNLFRIINSTSDKCLHKLPELTQMQGLSNDNSKQFLERYFIAFKKSIWWIFCPHNS